MEKIILHVDPQLKLSKPRIGPFRCSIDSTQVQRCFPMQDAAPVSTRHCTCKHNIHLSISLMFVTTNDYQTTASAPTTKSVSTGIIQKMASVD